MKQRKQTQLPKAFDKGCYSGISNLDADGWYTQFERRRQIAGLHDYLEQDFPPTEFDTTIETLREEMDAVLRSPLNWPPYTDSANLERISLEMATWLTAIHSPTIREFYQIEVKIPRKRRAEAVNEMRRVFPSAGSRTSELVSQVVRSPEAVGLVAVNLGLSDSALKADFAEWLSSIRLKGTRVRTKIEEQWSGHSKLGGNGTSALYGSTFMGTPQWRRNASEQGIRCYS